MRKQFSVWITIPASAFGPSSQTARSACIAHSSHVPSKQKSLQSSHNVATSASPPLSTRNLVAVITSPQHWHHVCGLNCVGLKVWHSSARRRRLLPTRASTTCTTARHAVGWIRGWFCTIHLRWRIPQCQSQSQTPLSHACHLRQVVTPNTCLAAHQR